jgi:hypothetical protein
VTFRQRAGAAAGAVWNRAAGRLGHRADP